MLQHAATTNAATTMQQIRHILVRDAAATYTAEHRQKVVRKFARTCNRVRANWPF